MSYNNRTDEIRRKRAQQRNAAQKAQARRRKNRNRKNNNGLTALFAVILLSVVVLCILSLTVFFKAKTVAVSGETRYTEKQIMQAAAIDDSQNLILLNKSKIEERITETLPFIGEVDIRVNLMKSSVTLNVTEAKPFAALYYENYYILVDNMGKYLEKTDSPKDHFLVYGTVLQPPEFGKMLQFGANDEMSKLRLLSDLLESFSATEVSKVDLSDPNNIRLLYGNNHIWELGGEACLSDRGTLEGLLKFCLETSEKEKDVMGIVNVASGNKYPFFREEVIDVEAFGLKVVEQPEMESSIPSPELEVPSNSAEQSSTQEDGEQTEYSEDDDVSSENDNDEEEEHNEEDE